MFDHTHITQLCLQVYTLLHMTLRNFCIVLCVVALFACPFVFACNRIPNIFLHLLLFARAKKCRSQLFTMSITSFVASDAKGQKNLTAIICFQDAIISNHPVFYISNGQSFWHMSLTSCACHILALKVQIHTIERKKKES